MSAHRHRPRVLAAAVVLAGALLPACGAARDVITQASEAVDGAVETVRYCVHAVELARAVEARDVDAAVAAGEELVAVAPEEIADEAQLLLDAAREARDGDPGALQREEVQQAAATVADFSRDTCDPRS